MLKSVYFFLFIILIPAALYSQTYLSQDFEGAWSGTPEAPTGWTQTRVVLIGDGVPDGILVTSGDKDWAKNDNTGVATWSLTPSTPGTVPNSAVSGTGVAWLQTRDFGNSGQNWGSRRLESPATDLSASTSPYLRFWMFYADGSTSTPFRVVISSDNGTTWNMLSTVVPNFTATTVNASTPWTRITLKIPAAFKTANMKIGIECTSPWGTNNLFIDDVTIEEYTPTTITSAISGNWSDGATWVGGVVPTSDNNVVIAAGHTVAMNVFAARAQDVTVNGILQYSSTTTTLLIQMFGDLTVNVGGTYNSFFSTTGKRTYLGGNLNNAGTINFAISATSTSEAALIWYGYGDVSFTNTGTISFNKINTIWHGKDGTVTYNSPVNNTFRCVLGNGMVNPNGNLTLGLSSSNTTMTIEKHKGAFTTAPLFGTGVTRSVSYLDGAGVTATLSAQIALLTRQNIVPGDEVEIISGTHTVAGTLLINTHSNVELSYPLNVGTATTGAMTLTRGIVITTPTNILRTSSFFTPPAGTAPSTATPSTTHGSYISGPIRIDFPTSTASRNFALGSGSNYNDNAPTANNLKTVVLATTSAWSSGTSITASITGKPSGSPTGGDPSSSIMGTRSYYLDLNGGSDLPATATIAIIGNNYIHGGGTSSDSLIGTQDKMRVVQSTSLTGPWTSRSATSGTGAFVDNTNYTRTTLAAAPGPISPLLTNGGYFAWGTSAGTVDMQALSIIPTGPAFYVQGTTNIPMTGVFKNSGILATSSTTTVTRTVVGTAYSDTKTIAAGLAAGASDTVQFADFTGWTSGVTYTIKDSCFISGDVVATNDTLSTTFTPSFAQDILLLAAAGAAKDSMAAHLGLLGITNYDYSSTLPIVSLSNWKTVIYLLASSGTWTAAVRDSLKAFLDNANSPTAKKSMLIFGNDLGYQNDPVRNVSAPAADTVFYRQYLHGKYIADDWVDLFVSSDSTLKGLGALSGVTAQRINDAFPDCITPAMWNQGSGVLSAALIPVNESGDGDSCSAVMYSAPFYNVFYGSYTYSSQRSLDPADRTITLSAIKSFIEGNNGALPVELTSFTASANKNEVLLKWITKSEINSHKFLVQRSIKENEWVKVGEVAAMGNSNTTHEYFFKDKLERVVKVKYRLVMVDIDGSVKLSDVVEALPGLPTDFMLSQNYPNPFNPTTRIEYQLPVNANVSLELFSITGERVASLLSSEQSAGYYSIDVNSSMIGKSLASGVYIYRMTAISKDGKQNFTNVKKMMLLR